MNAFDNVKGIRTTTDDPSQCTLFFIVKITITKTRIHGCNDHRLLSSALCGLAIIRTNKVWRQDCMPSHLAYFTDYF